MEGLAGKRVLVVGLGLSGRSAANWCAAAGAEVTAVDEGAIDAASLAELHADVQVRTEQPLPAREAFDLVVPSPGVPPARYRAGARRVWGDVELASRALSVPIVAVTGTNGKSTVTRLVEAGLLPTRSSTGSPTLPAARARSPAASRPASTSRVTVLLPFVPVTATIGTESARDASSTSPHTRRAPAR